MSSRDSKYREYFSFVPPSSAKRILAFVGILALAGELTVRLFPPTYNRTAVSSLHGIRTLFQMAVEDPAPKILAFGDSTLVGGGVNDYSHTVMGRFAHFNKSGNKVFDLAVPGGDVMTSLELLDALKQKHVRNVDRVILEVLPAKFVVNSPTGATSKDASQESSNDLAHFLPFIRPTEFGLAKPHLTFTEWVEAYNEYNLGNFSMLYRHRDYLRTHTVGNYPIFYAISHFTPASIRSRLFPAKAQGTNRLSAQSDDYPYDKSIGKPTTSPLYYFTPHVQGDYLEKAIDAAYAISAKPPVIVSMPFHYEYDKINAAQRASFLRAFNDLHLYLKDLAARKNCVLAYVPSERLQAPNLWTRTRAHFNSAGSERVWRAIRPELCTIYPCSR